jgi:hypothetical protein
MSKRRRQFKRPLGQKNYRKLFVIAVEGAKTEPQYFAMFNNQQSIIRIHCLKGAHSSPPYVLKRMLNYLRREDLKMKDEAWLVVDKDQWTDDQLIKLHEWSQRDDNYGFALSNPKFEYWLLFHFEDASGIKNSRDCVERLKKYLPGYDKSIDVRKISHEMIGNAIHRAEVRDNPPCKDWPKSFGSTTVYKLVKNIIHT